MKKIILSIYVATFLMSAAFSQSTEELNIRFDNRKKEGYFNITQISMLMGNRHVSERNSTYEDGISRLQTAPSVTMTHGGIIDKNWAAGIGAGVEIFDQNLFPIFADIRFTVRDHNISPFFAFKIGYAFSDLKRKHYDYISVDFVPFNIWDAWLKRYGGFMLHPEMGVKVPLNEKTDLLFTVAYRHQKTKTEVSQDFGQRPKWKREASMNRLAFGVAIMFR